MIGILIITVVSFILSILIVLVDKFISKENMEDKYLKHLPGYNCGACGFGSCSGMAKAMCKDKECYKKCRPLKGEALKQMEEFLNK